MSATNLFHFNLIPSLDIRLEDEVEGVTKEKKERMTPKIRNLILNRLIFVEEDKISKHILGIVFTLHSFHQMGRRS